MNQPLGPSSEGPALFETASSSAPTVGPGYRIGAYKILEEIGQGQFGVVFGARDLRTNELVAVKVLKPESGQPLRWFKEEGRLRSIGFHPSLLLPEEVLERPDFAALVMPFIEGTDFVSALSGATGLEGTVRDESKARDLIADLADALATLHARGVVHADVKPENVLVQPNGQVHLLDFGLAAELLSQSATGIFGTPMFLAPEVLNGAGAAPSADSYSLGLMLFMALTGTPLFGEHDTPLAARAFKEAPRLDSIRPGIGSQWVDLVAGLLERDAEQRLTTDDILSWAGRPRTPSSRGDFFVGRPESITWLTGLWRGVERGGPPVIAEISGLSGIGKTALVRHFVDSLREEARVVWGRCFENEQVPYRALDQVIAGIADLVEASEEAGSRLSAHEGRESLERLFPVFAHAHTRDTSTSSSEDREVGIAALGDVLRGLSGDIPLLLVIDDVQWGDNDSADVLATLLSLTAAPRCLVVLTRRSDTATGQFVDGIQQRVRQGVPVRVVELELNALDEQTSRSLLSAHAIDPSRADELVRVAGGNPFLLDFFAGSSALTSRLSDDLAARLSALSLYGRRLVLGTAQLEGLVPLESLAEACQVPMPTRLELRKIESSGLVRTTLNGNGQRALVLSHERLRASLRQQGMGDLGGFHAVLANALVKTGGEDGVLARHLLLAGQKEQAIHRALAAAERAEEVSAFSQAAEMLGFALNAGAEDSNGRLRDRLGLAYRRSGQNQEAAKTWLQLAEESEPSDKAARWRELAGETLLEGGLLDEGMDVVASNLQMLDEPGPRKGGRAMAGLAFAMLGALIGGRRPHPARRSGDRETFISRADACWAAGRCVTFVEPPSGMELLFRSVKAARRAGDVRRVARAQAILAGTVLGLVKPTRRIGERWLDEVETFAKTTNDFELRTSALLWRTLIALNDSKLDVVIRDGIRVTELLDDVYAASWERGQAASLVMRALLTQGDYARCAALTETFRRESLRQGNLYGQMLFGGYAIVPAIARGEFSVARSACEWLRTSWMPETYTIQRFCAAVYEAWCDILQGDPAKAATRMSADRRAYREAGLHRIRFSRMDWTLTEARIKLAGSEARGLRGLPAIAAELAKEGVPDATGHSLLLESVIARREGRTEEADRAEETAIAAFEEASVQLEPEALKFRRAQRGGDKNAETAAYDRLRSLGVNTPSAWVDLVLGASR